MVRGDDDGVAAFGRGRESRLFIDGRNLFDPAQVVKAAFSYIGVGRARRGD